LLLPAEEQRTTAQGYSSRCNVQTAMLLTDDDDDAAATATPLQAVAYLGLTR
jgi:hypothetical protein